MHVTRELCCHPNSCELITILCAWQDSSDAMACAQIGSNMIARNENTPVWIFSQISIVMQNPSWNVVSVQRCCWACRLTSLADLWAQCVSYIHNSPYAMQSASLASLEPHTDLYFDIPPQRITCLCHGYVQEDATVRCTPLDGLRGALQILNGKLTYLLVITRCDAGRSWSNMEVVGSCLICELWTGMCTSGHREGRGTYIARGSAGDMELQYVSLTMYTMRIFYDQSTLDRVMAWCCQVMASNHYLIQCWHRIRIVTFFAHTNGMGFPFIRYHIFMLCIRKIDDMYIWHESGR